ncbi:unnamed protein product [Cylicostephanus goldi]|uniref:Uncharacterized protein n=1 Tax=Cylicostephanus goldi TaxID=71465 RepID=A0A3P6TAD4_CYLGO|nr:unnamed protein product [Cylicostephanus goldi]
MWTNVLLTEPDRVLCDEHPVFACLAHGFYHIVMLVKSVIQNASVYEEEDFNPHLPFPCTSQHSLQDVLQFMKEVEHDLIAKAEKPDHASLKDVILSLSSRIAFLRLFLVTITHLVPPRRPECVDSDPLQMPPLDAVGFTADLDAAAYTSSKLMLLSSKFLETSLNEGAPRPEGVEHDGEVELVRILLIVIS